MPKARKQGAERPLIVVAEDVESIRTLLEKALHLSGFTAVTVSDGRQALEQIRALRPAAAVLDWYMPELDGVEVCTEVRAAPEIAGTPIVLLTGFDVAQAEGCGADAVLGKPFELAELMAVLGKLIGETSEARWQADEADPPVS
jgi:DNA-binding response OmpR family regulator